MLPPLLKAVVGEMASDLQQLYPSLILPCAIHPAKSHRGRRLPRRGDRRADIIVGSPILLADSQSAQQVIRTQTTLVVNDAQVNPSFQRCAAATWKQ